MKLPVDVASLQVLLFPINNRLDHSVGKRFKWQGNSNRRYVTRVDTNKTACKPPSTNHLSTTTADSIRCEHLPL